MPPLTSARFWPHIPFRSSQVVPLQLGRRFEGEDLCPIIPPGKSAPSRFCSSSTLSWRSASSSTTNSGCSSITSGTDHPCGLANDSSSQGALNVPNDAYQELRLLPLQLVLAWLGFLDAEWKARKNGTGFSGRCPVHQRRRTKRASASTRTAASIVLAAPPRDAARLTS
jgi:hypothetical protein